MDTVSRAALTLLALGVATVAWWRSEDIPGERWLGKVMSIVLIVVWALAMTVEHG